MLTMKGLTRKGTPGARRRKRVRRRRRTTMR
jgi:hypothetical protein